MTDNSERLRKLAKDGLEKFTIVEMTEVYGKDEDGRKAQSLGFFRDPTVAKAFEGNRQRPGSHWGYGMATHFVLTDGFVAFIVKPDLVNMVNDEQAALDARNAAIAKLSPEERTLLGL